MSYVGYEDAFRRDSELAALEAAWAPSGCPSPHSVQTRGKEADPPFAWALEEEAGCMIWSVKTVLSTNTNNLSDPYYIYLHQALRTP